MDPINLKNTLKQGGKVYGTMLWGIDSARLTSFLDSELLDYAIVNIRTPQTTTDTSVLPDLKISPSSCFTVSPVSDKEITISPSEYTNLGKDPNTF